MSGRIAANTEVAGGFYQWVAKYMCPDSIDPDPCGKCVLGRDNGLGHFQPATTLLERDAIGTTHNLKKLPWHLGTTVSLITTDEYHRFHW